MPIGLTIGANNNTNRPVEPIRFVSSSNKPIYSVQRDENGRFNKINSQDSNFPIGHKTFADIIRSKLWLESPLGKPGLSGGAFLVTADDGSQYVLKYMRGQPFYTHYVDSEINMLMALTDSPYVVQLLAASLYNEKAYILYPYIPGKTLSEWLRTRPDVDDRKKVYIHLMNGLIDIHSRGYVHRDVKPANIWIPDDSSQHPFYLDLGLTAPIDSDEVIPGGTPTYLKSEASKETSHVEQNYYALGKIIEDDAVAGLGDIAAVMKRDGFNEETMMDALTALEAGDSMPEIYSAASSPSAFSVGTPKNGGAENGSPLQRMNYPPTYTVAASPAPLSTSQTVTSWPGGVDVSASLFNTDNQKGGKNTHKNRKASRKNRKASRKNRKSSRKNRKVNRKH